MSSGRYAGTLLSALGEGWATAIHKPPPPPDMARAPLQPLLVVARRVPPPAPLPPVRLSFSAHLDGPDSEQIRSVLRVCPSNTTNSTVLSDQ